MKDKFGGVIEFWCQFIDSLSTRGGAIFLLLAACLGLGGLLMHILHHGDTGEVSSLIRNTFSGFAGALLLALKTTAEKASNGNGTSPKEPPQ